MVVIILWIVVAVVVANALFAAFLILRFRGERKRMAEARHRSEESGHSNATPRGSSRRHLA